MSKSQKGQKKISTIWLESETGKDGDKRKMFYCFNCRTPLIEYIGHVKTIVPGRNPYNPSTILKCKGSVQRSDGIWEDCGMYYSFAGSVYTKIPEST